MKAAIVARFGPNWSLAVGDAPKPEPGAGDVLVRVRAATVNRTDCGELLHPLIEKLVIARSLATRTILGMDFAGEVEAIGAGVSLFRPGDRVFGMASRRRNGAQAEYVLVPETGAIATIPPRIPFGEAAVCEGAYYASASAAEFALGPGHRILIYGASGAIGSAAAQLAKQTGANITAVVAARHLEMARSLGVDRVFDHAAPEFAKLGQEFDFVLDAVGKLTRRRWRPLLKPGGRFATTDIGPGGQSLMLLLWSKLMRNRQVTIPVPRTQTARAFVESLAARMAAGQFRAFVDRSYPLDAIADAYRYVRSGQKAGIVVIDMGD